MALNQKGQNALPLSQNNAIAMVRAKVLIVMPWFCVLAAFACMELRAEESLDFSSPEATIATHYRAYQLGDMELLEKVYGEVKWITKDQLREISRKLRGYRIVDRAEIGFADELNRKGDVYVGVEEQYEKGSVLMHFSLRQQGGRWVILGFNADDSADYPPEENVEPSTKG